MRNIVFSNNRTPFNPEFLFRIIVVIFLLTFTMISCNPTVSTSNPEKYTIIYDDTFPLFDLNGDNLLDTAFLLRPKLTDDGMSCIDSVCKLMIYFSGDIPPIAYEQSIGGFVVGIDDLNDDGIGEIIYTPSWFQSCWGLYNVYSYRNSNWELLAQPTLYWCNDIDYSQRVTKIDKEYFQVLEDTFTDEGIMTIEKKIRLK